jgi:hypothetical protein
VKKTQASGSPLGQADLDSNLVMNHSCMRDPAACTRGAGGHGTQPGLSLQHGCKAQTQVTEEECPEESQVCLLAGVTSPSTWKPRGGSASIQAPHLSSANLVPPNADCQPCEACVVEGLDSGNESVTAAMHEDVAGGALYDPSKDSVPAIEGSSNISSQHHATLLHHAKQCKKIQGDVQEIAESLTVRAQCHMADQIPQVSGV